MDYRTAPEVEAIAEDLIFDYHEVLGARGPVIDYVMMRSTGASETRMFQIKKVTGLNAFLAAERRPENFFTEAQPPDRVAILIGWFQWQTMTEEQQKGLVDHILCHLRYDYEKEGWRIEPPEYGEFPEVLERHGFWRGSLDKGFKEFAEVVSEQLSLLPEEDEEEGPEPNEEENLQVSITHNGRTVETDTNTMRRQRSYDGALVDEQTGEVGLRQAKPAGARSE